MVFNQNILNELIKNRSDMSLYLTHLTRRKGEDFSAVDVLLNILISNRPDFGFFKASKDGFINGSPVVCFQESNLYGIAQNAINHFEDWSSGKEKRLRYEPCGISLPKSSLYTLVDSINANPTGFGARPVIYERTEIAKQFLRPDQHWRIVNLNLYSDQLIDWTFEREWRVNTDFYFYLNTATILLYNTTQYQEFVNKLQTRGRIDILTKLTGIVVLDRLIY